MYGMAARAHALSACGRGGGGEEEEEEEEEGEEEDVRVIPQSGEWVRTAIDEKMRR